MRTLEIVLPFRGIEDTRKGLFVLDVANRLFGAPPDIWSSGVHYQREMPGQERWNTWPIVQELGYGDCEDLASWLGAQISGRSECFRAGPKLIHCITRKGPFWYDPSRALGM